MSKYLCDELIVEILARLPSKSLLRFRSVSKSLRSIIDSPSFVRMHTCRSPQRLVITHIVKHRYIEEYGAVAFCTLHAEEQLPLCPIRGYIGVTSIKFPSRDVGIVATSCNGILCLLSREGVVSVWNPSIMRQLTLPDCPRRSLYGVQFGLGFDPITDDNKIVNIPPGSEGTPFVYTIKTGTWVPIASPMPWYRSVLSRSICLNGVLHWVVKHDSKEDVQQVCIIMTFDLTTHDFGMIPLPKPNWYSYQVATFNGSLAVISTKDCAKNGDSWIWVRRDASWSMVFKSKANLHKTGVRKVVKLTNNGDLLLDTYCEGLQVYNPKTGVQSTLVESHDDFSLCSIEMYVESLHLLHVGTPCDVNNLFMHDKKRERV